MRELIRSRVYQEVKDHNAKRSSTAFSGLVQPGETEVALNESRPRVRPQVDWKRQFETAVSAFEQGRILVLVGDRQAESLEEPIELKVTTQVTFIRLVPLVGG